MILKCIQDYHYRLTEELLLYCTSLPISSQESKEVTNWQSGDCYWTRRSIVLSTYWGISDGLSIGLKVKRNPVWVISNGLLGRMKFSKSQFCSWWASDWFLSEAVRVFCVAAAKLWPFAGAARPWKESAGVISCQKGSPLQRQVNTVAASSNLQGTGATGVDVRTLANNVHNRNVFGEIWHWADQLGALSWPARPSLLTTLREAHSPKNMIIESFFMVCSSHPIYQPLGGAASSLIYHSKVSIQSCFNLPVLVGFCPRLSEPTLQAPVRCQWTHLK